MQYILTVMVNYFLVRVRIIHGRLINEKNSRKKSVVFVGLAQFISLYLCRITLAHSKYTNIVWISVG